MVRSVLATIVVGATLLAFPADSGAQEASAVASVKPSTLRVLFLTRDDTERTESFRRFLTQHFASVSVVKRVEFDPAQPREFDVAVLDWPQSERLTGEYASPLGPLEQWNTPLVLLGSAGLLMAGPWEVMGGAG